MFCINLREAKFLTRQNNGNVLDLDSLISGVLDRIRKGKRFSNEF